MFLHSGDTGEPDSGDRLLRERKSTDMEGGAVKSFLEGDVKVSSSTTSHGDFRFLLVEDAVKELSRTAADC